MAVDGCLVLLCFAAPSWRAIPQCVPPITQVLRDLARGRPFPTCGFAGIGNTATASRSSVPDRCPPQYTQVWQTEFGSGQSCDYDGVVSVTIDGAAFSRTWWSMRGDSVTEFLPEAKRRFDTWDPRFDDDYAAWAAAQAASAPVAPVDAP